MVTISVESYRLYADLNHNDYIIIYMSYNRKCMHEYVSFFTNLPRMNKWIFLVGLIGIAGSVSAINLCRDESLTPFFDNMHWTFGTVAAAALAAIGYRNSQMASRKTAYWFFLGFAGYALGQIVWDIQTAFSYNAFPSPSDLFYLWLGPCMTIALIYEVSSQNKKLNQSVFWLDLLALSVAALTLILVSYLPRTGELDILSMAVLVSYPITLLIPVLMVILMIPSMRLRLNNSLIVFLAGIAITAWSWMHWNSLALDGVTVNGSWFNITFSIAILMAGSVVSDWKLLFSDNERFDRISEAFLRFLPIMTVLFSSLAIIIVGTDPHTNLLVEKLVYFGAAIVIILAIIRQGRLLRERDRLLEAQSEILKSANLIKTIIQTAPLRIFWKDRDLNYLGCNDLFARDAGLEDSEQMIGKSDFEMGWKDQAELYRADDLRIIESGKATLGYEEPQTTPEGEQIWLRTSKVPLIDTSSGETIGILGVYDDITLQYETAQRLRYALSGASDGLWDWNMKSGKVYYSPRWFEMLGHQYGDFPETLDTWSQLVHPEDKELTLSKIEDYLEGRLDKFEIEFRMKHKDGHWVDILSRAKFVTDDQGNLLEPHRLVGTHVDITERKKYESSIKQQKEEFETMFHISKDPIAILDLESNFLDFNDAYLEMTGFTREELLATSCIALSAPEDVARSIEALNTVFEKGSITNYEKTCIAKNDKRVIINMAVSLMPDKQRILISVKDVTESKNHERQLEHVAHYDALTGLPNRVLNADRLRQAMLQSSRRHEQIGVLYLDLDGFKEVNDTYGHSMGDKFLIALASQMQQALRESDTLSRLGGDEFVAILADLNDHTAAFPVIERLLHASSRPIEIDDVILQVSASIGVTFYPQSDEVDADQLIRQADQAMYEAKQSGKNRYHIFDSEHDRTIRQRHENLERIEQALKNNEFVLFYQPKINMRTGDMVGVEALIRWQHPEDGLIPPLEFLPYVEDHPLAVDIGEWVINEAVSQIERWQEQGFVFPVSINVGARQLLQGDFVQRFQKILAEHENFDSSLLEIEVLETSALEDVNMASNIIDACKGMGTDFALDDFGTGYSSLTYLKKLPVKTLKIDQSFVRDMLDDRDDLAILEGITGLAKAFDREVIAEGVETYKHGQELLSLGCDLAQGYGIARPMPAEKLIEWSEQWAQDHRWVS